MSKRKGAPHGKAAQENEARGEDTAAQGIGDPVAALDGAPVVMPAGENDDNGSVEAVTAAIDFMSDMAADDGGLADELDDDDVQSLAEARSAYGDHNTLAAFCAAQVSFGQVDGSHWNGLDRSAEQSKTAAAFIRANPDAPADALPIELKLRGFKDLPDITPRVLLAWRVFAFTLKETDALDAAQATPAPAEGDAPIWPGERAMEPVDEPFSPTGNDPR